MLRQVSIFVIAALLLAGSTGISVFHHYCAGYYEGASLLTEKKCCCKKPMNNCCKNEEVIVQIETDQLQQQIQEFDFNIPYTFTELLFNTDLLNTRVVEDGWQISFERPPPLDQDLWLLNGDLRFYS